MYYFIQAYINYKSLWHCCPPSIDPRFDSQFMSVLFSLSSRKFTSPEVFIIVPLSLKFIVFALVSYINNLLADFEWFLALYN